MVIVPNFVYNFTFKNIFSSLDGIYRVESISSYAELLKNNIDVYKLTYKEYGATDDMFRTDLDKIRSGNIAKLISVTDEEFIIYIPEHIFDKIPDGSVQKYLKLGLVITLGIFDNAEDLNTIKSEVDQVVSSMIGIEDKTTIFNVNSVWMTSDNYQTLDNDRNAAITRISNHFTDKQGLLKEIDSLKTKIAYYENLIKSINAE